MDLNSTQHKHTQLLFEQLPPHNAWTPAKRVRVEEFYLPVYRYLRAQLIQGPQGGQAGPTEAFKTFGYAGALLGGQISKLVRQCFDSTTTVWVHYKAVLKQSWGSGVAKQITGYFPSVSQWAISRPCKTTLNEIIEKCRYPLKVPSENRSPSPLTL